jgi:lipase
VSVLHVVRYGERGDHDGPAAPPLLAVHGVTGHARRWERLATDAWPHRQVVAVDLRGHGFSTWEPPWSLGQAVDDLLDTLDHLGLDVVDLVGHSYGGALGIQLLARAPDRLRRLVLLDPGFDRPRGLMAAEAAGFLAADGWATLDEAIAARSAGWLHVGMSDGTAGGGLADREGAAGALHPDVADEIDRHLVEGPDGRFRFRFARAAAVSILGELCLPVPAVTIARPTLLVTATAAGVVTPAVVARLRAELGPALDEATLPCGHMVFWDRFDETAALVERFLGAAAADPGPDAAPDPSADARARA